MIDVIKSFKQSEIRSTENNICRFWHGLSVYIKKIGTVTVFTILLEWIILEMENLCKKIANSGQK